MAPADVRPTLVCARDVAASRPPLGAAALQTVLGAAVGAAIDARAPDPMRFLSEWLAVAADDPGADTYAAALPVDPGVLVAS